MSVTAEERELIENRYKDTAKHVIWPLVNQPKYKADDEDASLTVSAVSQRRNDTVNVSYIFLHC